MLRGGGGGLEEPRAAVRVPFGLSTRVTRSACSCSCTRPGWGPLVPLLSPAGKAHALCFALLLYPAVQAVPWGAATPAKAPAQSKCQVPAQRAQHLQGSSWHRAPARHWGHSRGTEPRCAAASPAQGKTEKAASGLINRTLCLIFINSKTTFLILYSDVSHAKKVTNFIYSLDL